MSAGALLPFDPTELAVAELPERGIRIRTPIIDTEIEEKRARVWMSHSEYDRQAPSHEAMDRVYARTLARQHLEATGGLDGLVLLRSFPCLGRFRYAAEDEVQCDRCGAALGLGPSPEEPSAEEIEQARQDDIPF